MFPEKLLLFHLSILFSVLSNANSLHVQESDTTNNHNINDGPFRSHPGATSVNTFTGRQQQIALHGLLMDADRNVDSTDRSKMGSSNWPTNINRNSYSYSPLLHLPVADRQPIPSSAHYLQYSNTGPIFRAHPRASASRSTNGSPMNAQYGHLRPRLGGNDLDGDRYEDNNEDKEQELISGLFGKVHLLGNGNNKINNRPRTMHYGKLSTTILVDDQDDERHHNVPYKQEHFLKAQKQHVPIAQQAALEENDIPTGDDGDAKKKRTEQPLRTVGAEELKQTTTTSSINQGAAEGHRVLVSKKSNPFLGDTSSMIPHSIASQLMLRSARGQRQYDVPQIGK